MKRLSIAVVALLPTLLHADALIDLRTTLAQMAATTAVHGTFEIESTSKDSDDAQAFPGKAAVGFEIDERGLRIIYPNAMLAQAIQEARAEAVDPERQTPVRSGVGRVQALKLVDLLNASSKLTTELLSAQLIDVKPSTWRAKPARIISMRLSPKLSKNESKHIKKYDSTLSVWVGDDGVPLAAESKVYVKASLMLISFEQNQTEKWEYARAGDRLVTVRDEQDQKSDGFGQHNATHVVEVVRLEP